ncbi:hypothetical protein CALVIDRAFT_557830 [Calocera viscosa TUFC12733]|uniref:Aminoglycoside phosphotransferase domain-containing protein n=1 Tax=Calocera viscosa (strain TUFC12733) TaxID=1330018 RepID=A0A167HV86_CALVF|nr:hypothetical protein CALVIDRAFT_557830 [Calocera viscosa TUFC12733]
MDVPYYQGTPVRLDADLSTSLLPANIPLANKFQIASILLFGNPIKLLNLQHRDGNEVSTMEHLRRNYRLPIPMVYAFCGDASFLDERFIIMEPANGVPLGETWDKWTSQQQGRFVGSLATFVSNLSTIYAPRIGAPIWSSSNALPSVGAISVVTNHRGGTQVNMDHSAARQMVSLSKTESWLKQILADEVSLAPAIWLAGEGRNSHNPAPFLAIAQALEKMIPNILTLFEPEGTLYCLVPGPHTLTEANILVQLEGPNAGEITALVNWDGTNFLPMWMLAKRLSNMLECFIAEEPAYSPSASAGGFC